VPLASGSKAWVVDCLDDHARFLVAALACASPTGEAAWACFVRASAEYGRRNEALGTLGRAFSIDAGSTNAFSKLARYESNIERALFRALQELQHLQSACLGNDQDADLAPLATLSGSTE